MGDSQLWDSISIMATRRAPTSKTLCEGFKRRQEKQERRMKSIIAQNELLR